MNTRAKEKSLLSFREVCCYNADFNLRIDEGTFEQLTNINLWWERSLSRLLQRRDTNSAHLSKGWRQSGSILQSGFWYFCQRRQCVSRLMKGERCEQLWSVIQTIKTLWIASECDDECLRALFRHLWLQSVLWQNRRLGETAAARCQRLDSEK